MFRETAECPRQTRLQGDFMGLIQWKEKYSVGISKIDKQHKRYVAILNRIIARQFFKGNDDREIEGILDELQGYTKEHFRTEEEYMLEHHFPGYKEHRSEHHQFRDRLFEARKEYSKYRQLISVNLFNFVWDGFSQHILNSDKRLRRLSEARLRRPSAYPDSVDSGRVFPGSTTVKALGRIFFTWP